ncbi:MAG: hypothetical protein FWC50_05830 [Planctomycetaceae bacterium]|nr:hypothetical protein [Planctomycetaceae bacterium]
MNTIRFLTVIFCLPLLVVLPVSCVDRNQQPMLEESVTPVISQESQQPVKYSFSFSISSYSPVPFSLDTMPPLEDLDDLGQSMIWRGLFPQDTGLYLRINYLQRFDNEQEALAKRGELRKSRFTDENETVSNTELFRIAHEQYTHGFFHDAMITFQMVKPQEPSRDLLVKIHNQGYDPRYYIDNPGDLREIQQTDIYRKDRLLRHFARVRFLHWDSPGAVQTARMIFSEPERNLALLEIMRAQCYGAVMLGKDKEQYGRMIEKAHATQSYLSGPAKDYGLGYIAYTHLHHKDNDSEALEIIDQIQSDSCRDEALEWMFNIIWFRDDDRIKEEFKKRVTDPIALCRMRLEQVYHDYRSTVYSTGGEPFLATLDDIRDLAMKQPPSQEKFDFLYLIGREYAYHDPARAFKVLMAVFDDIKTLDAADPLLIANALEILRTNKQYMISYRGGVTSIYSSLPRETILEIGNLILEKTREKYTRPVETTNGHKLLNGKYAIIINRVVLYELPTILTILLDNDIPEAAETVFALGLKRNDLIACYRALSALYVIPHGFQEHEQRYKEMLDRLSPGTQAHFLAAMYEPCFRRNYNFPAENYMKWLEESPDALKLIQRIYIDHSQYLQSDKVLNEPHYGERFAKLKEMLAKTGQQFYRCSVLPDQS